MKCRVHYVSPRGCAEALAEAIAREAHCQREPLLPAYMPENLKLMFLGCEGSRADKVTLEFIQSMCPERVKNVALFCCTSGKGVECIGQMRRALEKRGVNVLDISLIAPIKGLFRKGPSEADLANAHAFARACVEMLGIEKGK